MLTCTVCGTEFERAKTGAPAKTCSKKCRSRAYYLSHGAIGRKRRVKPDPAEQAARLRAYWREYWNRPENRERRNARHRERYATEEYREWAQERWRRLYGDPFADVVIPSPYTGHRWLEMAREAVTGGRDIDPAFRDFGMDDEIGEALLALLEGRSMDEAVKEFRAKEYVPRHLTVFTSDWHDNEDEGWKEDRYMPSVPSAEEEVVAMETVGLQVASRVNWKKNSRRGLGSHSSRTQPSRRRMKDGKSWKKHAA